MSPVKKIYTSIASFAILYLLLIAFLILPAFSGIKQSSQEFLAAKNKLASLTGRESELKERVQSYEKYREDLAKIDNVFVNAEVPLDLINFLEESSANSEIELTIASITGKIDKEDPWPSLVFQLSATGSFPNFSEFLARLESGPYLIDILDLTARQKTPEGEVEEVLFNLSIKVFAG